MEVNFDFVTDSGGQCSSNFPTLYDFNFGTTVCKILPGENACFTSVAGISGTEVFTTSGIIYEVDIINHEVVSTASVNCFIFDSAFIRS